MKAHSRPRSITATSMYTKNTMGLIKYINVIP